MDKVNLDLLFQSLISEGKMETETMNQDVTKRMIIAMKKVKQADVLESTLSEELSWMEGKPSGRRRHMRRDLHDGKDTATERYGVVVQ